MTEIVKSSLAMLEQGLWQSANPRKNRNHPWQILLRFKEIKANQAIGATGLTHNET
jgi:hypothetical protein